MSALASFRSVLWVGVVLLSCASCAHRAASARGCVDEELLAQAIVAGVDLPTTELVVGHQYEAVFWLRNDSAHPIDFCYVHRLSAGYQYGDGEWFPLRLGGLASHNRCTDPTRLAGGERVDFEFSVAVPDELTGEGTLVGYYELELPPACRGKESDGVPLASRTSVVFRGEDRSLHDGDT